METIELKRGVPAVVPIQIWDDTDESNIHVYDISGLTVFISVKKLSDDTNTDAMAVISSKITVHSTPTSGMTNWTLSAAQTLIHVGEYKADVKVYSGAVEMNSDEFRVKIVEVVTKRTV
jgi:hypothetical protein